MGEVSTGLQEPNGVLDCANSGTTIRLMTGCWPDNNLLAFSVALRSYAIAPMGRIINPITWDGCGYHGAAKWKLCPFRDPTARLRSV